jgi:hypothetical protein
LEGVIAEHDMIKREVGWLRQLVEKSGAVREEEDFGGGVGAVGEGGEDEDDASIPTVVPHVLESVEEDGEQMAKRQQHPLQQEE